MPAPKKDIVVPIIGEHRQSIVDIVLGAWDDWRNSKHLGVWRTKRGRANFVWEQIIDRAHFVFDGSKSVIIRKSGETFLFLVDGQVCFRFKKADHVGLSANIPTQLALAFHNHQLDLPGLHDLHRVEIVYQLNFLETEIFDVLIVGRDNDVVAWTHSLLDIGETVMPLPMPISAPPASTTRRLVQQRSAPKVQERKERD